MWDTPPCLRGGGRPPLLLLRNPRCLRTVSPRSVLPSDSKGKREALLLFALQPPDPGQRQDGLLAAGARPSIPTMPVQAAQWTEFLSCPICYNEFDEAVHKPISLGCSHTVCKTCLNKLHRKACPFDQTAISTDIDVLPVNFALLQLVGAQVASRGSSRQQGGCGRLGERAPLRGGLRVACPPGAGARRGRLLRGGEKLAEAPLAPLRDLPRPSAPAWSGEGLGRAAGAGVLLTALLPLWDFPRSPITRQSSSAASGRTSTMKWPRSAWRTWPCT